MAASASQLCTKLSVVLFLLVLAGCAGSRGKGAAEAASSTPRCEATVVHYRPYRGAANGLAPIPWIAASPTSAALIGHLFYYDGLNTWKRRQFPRLRIYTGGEDPKGRISMKILWELRRGSAPGLSIRGKRLDGAGSFSQRQQGSVQFPSIVQVPREGCWRLTLTAGKVVGTVTVIAVPGGST